MYPIILWKIAVLTVPNMTLYILLPGLGMWVMLSELILNGVLLESFDVKNAKKIIKQVFGH